MPRPPVMPAEDKFRIVLALLSGEVSVAAAARRHGVSEQTVGNWKRQFLAGGLVALGGTASGPAATREAALRAEVEHLRSALAEAQVQLRVWKRSAERRLPPFDDLEVIRQDAAMPVSRFCTLTGIPRRTYTRWLTNPPDQAGGTGARPDQAGGTGARPDQTGVTGARPDQTGVTGELRDRATPAGG